MAEKIRNYSSNYDIKEFLKTEFGQKYFNMDELSTSNVGVFGFTTDILANTSEDTFNAVNTYIKEIFPNKATLASTIYNNAALYNVNDLFANPAKLSMVILLNEREIIHFAEKKTNQYEYKIDSDTRILVEDIEFMLDYDIIIQAKKYKDSYVYTALYDNQYTNSSSDLVNPYIKTKLIPYGSSNYLALMITVRQVKRKEYVENIINNDKINMPKLKFEFDKYLSSIDVLCKEPGELEYKQLKLLMYGAPPVKTPFCYYNFIDDYNVEISFTSRDGYFQPKFNSEIKVILSETKGDGGNFPLYKGNEIVIIPTHEKYEYNTSTSFLGIVQSASVDGRNAYKLQEIKDMYLESMSTLDSYTTENDLQNYFNNFKIRTGTDITFIKKRDDVRERMFGAFSLMRDKYNSVYHTNTLNLEINLSDFDIGYEQSNKYILKPGRLFSYSDLRSDLVIAQDKTNSLSTVTIDPNSKEYTFTNPFLITMGRKPEIVGFYINNIDASIPMDYVYVNSDSPNQFLCNTLEIKRDSMMGEDEYVITVTVSPSGRLEEPIVDIFGKDNGLLKVKGAICNEFGEELYFVDFSLKSFREDEEIYTYELRLKTDDYISNKEKLRFLDVLDLETLVRGDKIAPMQNAIFKVLTFYSNKETKLPAHSFTNVEDLISYNLTNIFSTESVRIDYVKSINNVRSKIRYLLDAVSGTYSTYLTAIPLVKASEMQIDENRTHFMEQLKTQYEYASNVLSQITNNFVVDLKFYNTYGRSKNFLVADGEQILDRVDISIYFKIKGTVGIDEGELRDEVKVFIKDYLESANDNGSNGVYISNLIQSLENKFPEINYLKFIKLNDYDPLVQTIESNIDNIKNMTREEIREYVPEYLSIRSEDIHIEFIYK